MCLYTALELEKQELLKAAVVVPMMMNGDTGSSAHAHSQGNQLRDDHIIGGFDIFKARINSGTVARGAILSKDNSMNGGGAGPNGAAGKR